MHRLEQRLGGPGEAQELIYEGIDPINLVSDEIGKGLAKIGILITLRQQLRESLDRDERVLDFVRHASRESAEARQSIAAANLEFESLERSDVGQHHQRAQHLAVLAMKDRATRPHDDTSIIGLQKQFAIFLAFAGAQSFAQQVAKSSGKLD